MKYLKVRNWEKFQHYKDRNPPWIKLATDVFQNYDFACLQDASKLLAICSWVLASKSKDGSVPGDLDFIKKVCFLNSSVKIENLKELIDKGFLIDASNLLADCLQDASTPLAKCYTRGEERRGEAEENTLSGKPDDAHQILKFLNEKAGKNFHPVEANLRLIKARLAKSSLQECKSIIAKKVREWKGTENEIYLRPATLFNATKFAQYQGQLIQVPETESETQNAMPGM